MSDSLYTKPPESDRVSAANLRKKIADNVIEEAKKKADKARKNDDAKQRAYQEFMDRHFTEADRIRIRGMIEKAAENNLFEINILTFPSEYLEDHGRRINSADANWREHLSGYAKSLCEAFEDLGQPQGYKLIARILNYPDGMIGDIGLFVSWKA